MTVEALEAQLTPQTKKACQELLREMGFVGAKVDKIEPDRFYILTSPVFGERGMRRRALTFIFEDNYDDTLHVECVEGWVVV